MPLFAIPSFLFGFWYCVFSEQFPSSRFNLYASQGGNRKEEGTGAWVQVSLGLEQEKCLPLSDPSSS